MNKTYGTVLEEQVQKTVREAQSLGDDLRKDFDEAVSRGKETAGQIGADAQDVADRTRDYVESARKKVGRAADRVSTYADDNTALVAIAAFGIGLLVGSLLNRRS
jgi:ElaB/YqjD/DUF883 family membrane-anchored ribosome-binding protein